MIRFLFTTAVSGLIASMGLAQNPVPMAMPGGATPPAMTKPQPAATTMAMPTSPTITQEMVAESCRDSGSYCEPRLGLLQRLSVLWTGRHCEAPMGSPSSYPGHACDGYVPQYNYGTVACSTACATDRCGRFGVGRFIGNRGGNGCPTSLVGRMRLFAGWHTGGHEKEHCRVATPYVTPARHYFDYDRTELSYNCQMGVCNGAGGCVNSGSGLSGGLGGGRLRSGEGLGLRNGEGLGLRNRSGCSSCGRYGEGCVLVGTTFSDTLRYARDEKMNVPAVIVSEQHWPLSGSIYNYYNQRPVDAKPTVTQQQPVQQAGYQLR